MVALAMFFDFGPLGPMILLGTLAVLAALVLLAGIVVGIVITLLLLRRSEAGSPA